MTAQSHPNHHPCCNTLLRYAAGTLSPAMHMFVASHLAYCPQCRQELQAYESQAGLGLEALPPEELDVGCLQNLLSKIDEHGPIACIDVTIPIKSASAFHYPEPLQPFAGVTGERIHWKTQGAVSSWTMPGEATTLIYKIGARQSLTNIAFAKDAILLILNGGFDDYQRGDIVKSKSAVNMTTTGETLFLVITPAPSDKPSWFQRLMSFVFGDKK
ncbi:MAG: hypothetical protein SFW65_05370 [Alphaproteobacteria bacterium]|nr:hypothetical protein [Alphaproteobacteria bacterium]